MVATKAPIQQAKAKSLIHDFFKEFQHCCNNENVKISTVLEKLLDPSFELFLNGRQVCKNLTNYIHFIEKIKNQFTNLEIQPGNNAPLIADNQLIVQYDVNLIPEQGTKRNLRMMAIATLDGNKITKWEQLSHEKK